MRARIKYDKSFFKSKPEISINEKKAATRRTVLPKSLCKRIIIDKIIIIKRHLLETLFTSDRLIKLHTQNIINNLETSDT